MATCSTLRDEMRDRGEFPQVPNRWLLNALVDGLKEICRNTWIYEHTDTFLTTANTYEYTLTPPANTLVQGIINAQFATIVCPTISVAAAETGGTLGAGTYSYRVTAYQTLTTGVDQETLPCAASTDAVVGATGSVVISWTQITDADGYKVYGRTADAEELLSTITSSSTVSYTDTGSDTPSGALPTESVIVREIEVLNVRRRTEVDKQWRQQYAERVNNLLWDGGTTIRLGQIPDTANYGVQVRVALYPTADITIPAAIDPFRETIKDYARAMLYLMPPSEKVTWSNPELGRIFMDKYLDKERQMKWEAFRGHGGNTRVKMRYFA